MTGAKSVLMLCIGNSRRSQMTAAIGLFGFESGAALATVVGVLVDVPFMVMGSGSWMPSEVDMNPAHAEGGRACTSAKCSSSRCVVPAV